MRIALLGTTGLIGANIAARLGLEHEIVAMGRRPESEVRVDLSRPEVVAALDLRGFDALVHCGGVVDGDFVTDAAEAWQKSTLGMSILVERVREAKVGAMVYLSTSHVYGPPLGMIDERTCPAPLTDYAIAHLAAERILARAARAGNLRALVLRPNAVFGMPPLETFDRWNLIPFSFPAEAVYKQEIVLQTSGEQRRNFVGAEDLACWTESFLLDSSPGIRFVNPIGPDTLSVYDLARRCAAIYDALTGLECKISRPPDTDTQPGSDFVYSSVAVALEHRQSVDNYLDAILRQLLAKRQDGHRYGN